MPGITRRASISVLGGPAVCAAVGLMVFLSGGCALSATEQIGGARTQPASAIEDALSRGRDEITGRVEVFRGRGMHGPFSPYTECIFRVRKN